MSTTLAPDSQLKDLATSQPQPSATLWLVIGLWAALLRPDGPGGRLWAGG